ncbi:ABC transporter permease [Cellulosimicrobium protaetiae]|uniref:ABC transporter permease n=1 Tax=Cellulosimicrobium protaetiae TaxID=2587808 RepID=A0A6M5UKY4_9MICO|nr:ABC transporter permease [Cellulosimicrobium protaetiae]QJW37901.1 ABC transporter permease [Cellulosimicrobium protaetiae]
MGRYVLRRAGQGLFVLWAAFTISFFVLYLLPSDPAALMASGGGEADQVDPALLDALRAQYGLDRPVLVQYGDALWHALRLDFGTSYSSGAPATQLVLQALPETLKLTAAALVLAVVAGAGIAIASTFPRATWLRHALASLPPLGVALPPFWLGLLLLQWLSFQLPVFPAIGNEGAISLVLPAITLAVPASAALAQVLARSLRGTLDEPYVETARAKGASRARVHFGHALRNAAIPALTVLGVLVGGLLGGTVVTETVFSRAGLGRLTVTSVDAQDIPVVQAVVVLSALVFVVVTLVVDLLYPLLDPRIDARQKAVAA